MANNNELTRTHQAKGGLNMANNNEFTRTNQEEAENLIQNGITTPEEIRATVHESWDSEVEEFSGMTESEYAEELINAVEYWMERGQK